MRKSLKRALERLRGKTSGAFRGKTSARSGLQEPQRMLAHS